MDKESLFISMMPSEKIGDDAAVVEGMIYSSDIFCEGSHFRREWMSMRQIGRKAMLVNISDAVAMNADPRYALVNATLPRNISQKEMEDLAEGLRSAAMEYGCEIIGGDTVGGECVHLSITIISDSSDPLFRSGMREGQFLAYTGSLGESRRTLHSLLEGGSAVPDSRFYEPVLRRDFVKKARKHISCGMDISDGLMCDLGKMLDMNGYGYEILIDISDAEAKSGEEYEMLFAFDEDELPFILEISEDTDTPINVFGRVTKKKEPLPPCGDHHFGSSSPKNISK